MYGVGPSAPVPQPPPLGPQMAPPMNIMAGPVPPMMDPSSNNQPLQFNTNKGKPPVAIVKDSNSKDERQNMSQSPDSGSTPVGGLPGMAAPVGQIQAPNIGPWGPVIGPNMMGIDPSMMMAAYNQHYAGYMGPMPPIDGPAQKEIVTLKSCVLYPPPPNAPPPSTRERPPGCRTVFVGGLPELTTEEILREIFENCGPICSIRMSKKNFAHIRFEMEECVERCLYLSGYRIKIENKDDKPNTGRIHVDYAQARDDLYEWECKQRAYAREERHRMRMEEEKFRPPSPPPVIHFSEHEASLLLEKLKSDDTFLQATHVLVTWLERGDCNRRNANLFYSMVQSTNAHIRRILSEKQALNEEFTNMKLRFRQRLEAIIKQFEQIESVFKATSKQKAWDHFSKAQRKNLDLWRKQTKEIVETEREEFLREREEAEMEMSDSEDAEGSSAKKKKSSDVDEYAQQAVMEWQMGQLREENDSLKCQLEAYKNEVDLLKLETRNTDDSKDKQIKALQQALQGMQQQLIQAKQQMRKDEEEVTSLKAQVVSSKADSEKGPPEIMVVSTIVQEKGDPGLEDTGTASTGIVDSSAALSAHTALAEKEARVLALLSTFLHVHPFGASLDYIWSYLQRLEIKVRTSELEDLLERYPGLYKQTIYGVGASIEKRWKFIGFEATSSTPTTTL